MSQRSGFAVCFLTLCLLGLSLCGPARGDLVVELGHTLIGGGVMTENLVNHGDVLGLGAEADLRLTFDSATTVSGDGYFENVFFAGTVAPGNSPGVVTTTNASYGGTLQFELGGTEPGFGADNHDQINDTATVTLSNNPTIQILPWNDFVPTAGDTFEVMTWQDGLVGSFGNLLIDQFFLDQNISFTTTITNTSGPGSLILTAIPEASAPLFLGLCSLATGAHVAARRCRKRRLRERETPRADDAL